MGNRETLLVGNCETLNIGVFRCTSGAGRDLILSIYVRNVILSPARTLTSFLTYCNLFSILHEEEVITSESSAVASTFGIASHADALVRVGPLKMGERKKKSNRGRKPMKSAILTSPEVVTNLEEKAKLKKDKAAKQGPPPKKRRISRTKNRKQQLSSDENKDIDFYIICYEDMPAK